MQRLKLIQGLFNEAADLLDALQMRYGAGKGVTREGFFNRIVGLFADSVAVERNLDQAVKELKIADLAPLVFLFHGLHKLVRLAHDKLFAKARDRHAMMQAVQKELDRAVMLEKEE